MLYGRGVFTTIAVREGAPWLWEKHWKRLARDAGKAGVRLDLPEQVVKQQIAESLSGDNITDGRIRITLYDQLPGEVWPGVAADETPTRLSILVGERRPVPRPFRCNVSPHSINSRSPLAGVKSCNYLENVLAIEDANRRGFHEAVRLNEQGHVAGACMANLFWLRGGRLSTPALSTGCLPGTTRELVLENVECDEVTGDIDELADADAVFLTSAGLGIIAVDEFNGRRLQPVDHPVLRLISPSARCPD